MPIDLTPNYIELLPAKEKISVPDGEFDMAQLLGGWIMGSDILSKGKMQLQATEERMLAGVATEPLTGIGIFVGKDGSDYEFRVGDPDNNYFHYNGTDLTLKGGTITAGSIEIGTNAWHVDSSGNMWWGSSSTYGGATISISAAGLYKGAIFNNLVADGGRIDLSAGVNEISIFPASGTTNKSSVVGLTAELRLRMEQAGGFVTLYAQNDADATIEVLRVDGNAGVSVGGSLPFNVFNAVINNTGAGSKVALLVSNAGTNITGQFICTHATTITSLIYGTTAGANRGIELYLTKTTNNLPGVFIKHSGLGIVGSFQAESNVNRTNPVVVLSAVANQGAHLRMNDMAGNPQTPTDGDIWFDGSDLKMRIGVTTYKFDKTSV